MAQIAVEPGEERVATPTHANPAPLGLCGFALTTFVLSTVNAGWFSLASLGAVVALAVAYGGLAQLLAGMWEFKAGNTFGAVAFSSYGAFWLSFAALFIPLAGVTPKGLASIPPSGIGIYLLGWGFFTFLMFLGALRRNMALIVVLGLLTITYVVLAIGWLANGGTGGLITLGGYLGILTALAAWYTALADILNSGKAIFNLPVGPMS
jgi:succinate-acetate transporter protein